MEYILIEDKQTIHLNTTWKPRMFQSELDDLEVDFKISPIEPGEYIKINDNLEIFPVVELIVPECDQIYEELNGPFWDFENQEARGYYTKTDKSLDIIKNTLKQLVASIRYKKEVAGVKTTIQETEITVETDKETRNIFVQKYILMGDSEIINWKFPETWLALNKLELGTVIFTGATYIQAQFDWEKGIVDQIELSETIEDLKLISMEG